MKWMREIVWMAVASVLFMVASLIWAYVGHLEGAVATGSCAIATAILSTRAK